MTQPVFQIIECDHCTDAWTWVVRYRDGSTLLECPGNGVHHAFADIDQEQALTMVLVPKRQGLAQIGVHMSTPTMRPIFFRRRYLTLNTSGGSETGRQTIHCLGWEDNATESFTFAFEDGGVLLTADRNAV